MSMKCGFWILCFMLAGCATTQPKYYRLPIKATTTQHAASQPLLVVEPVALARFLNTPRMVYQTSETSFDYVHAHLWLPSLCDQITDYMIDALRRSDVSYWAVRVSNDIPQKAARLCLRFDRFDFNRAGIATIQGEWQLVQFDKVVKQAAFNHQMDLGGKGYDQFVLRLSQLLNDLAKAIAEKLNQ